jgi:XTP/dITP diphosphohydrolase
MPIATAQPMLLATRSRDKLREIRAILGARLASRLISLEDAAVEVEPEEDGIEVFTTFRANAVAKARYFHERSGLPTLADDSGICVDALAGAPGVRSRRFAASPGAGVELDRANNEELLRRLAGVPPTRRTAHYTCAAAFVAPRGAAVTVIGTCSGLILEAPRGSGGFGYDPLFLVPTLDATFAEIPLHQKNRRSHRARAFRALAASLPDRG